MSYILDALKKSEQERKRGDVPGLQTVHIPLAVEHKSPRMLYGLIVLLMLLLAFLVGLIMAGGAGDSSIPAPVSQPAISGESGGEVTSQESVRPQLDPGKPEPAVAEAPVSIRPVASKSSEPAYVSADNGLQQKTELAMTNVPYLHELEDYKQQSIPRLNFAGHVYSSSALNRSVIINGHAMSEGDSIVQGLHVEQITPSGVIFGFQGDYFRVDILQDWSFE